jgi:hypothetical protein
MSVYNPANINVLQSPLKDVVARKGYLYELAYNVECEDCALYTGCNEASFYCLPRHSYVDMDRRRAERVRTDEESGK